MSCPWTFAESLDLARLVVTILGFGTGLYFAGRGLKTWKDQLRGTSQYELARRVLTAVHKLRRELQYARSAWMGVNEYRDRTPQEGETPYEARIRNEAHLYQKRVQPIQAGHDELELLEHEALAVWGVKAPEPIQQLRKCVRRLNATYNSYFHSCLDDRDFERTPTGKKFSETLFAPPENDEFAEQVNSAVGACEQYFRSYLK